MKGPIVWLLVSWLIVVALLLVSCGPAEVEEEEVERAIEDYDEAIRLDPQYAGAYFGRGLVYKLHGKKAEALADFGKFITLNDNPLWLEMARPWIEQPSE